MRSLLKMLALPAMAFALASAGAVSTNVSHQSKAGTVLITGYIHETSSTSCETVEVNCAAVPGDACTYRKNSIDWQVFRKNVSNGPCTYQLSRL